MIPTIPKVINFAHSSYQTALMMNTPSKSTAIHYKNLVQFNNLLRFKPLSRGVLCRFRFRSFAFCAIHVHWSFSRCERFVILAKFRFTIP